MKHKKAIGLVIKDNTNDIRQKKRHFREKPKPHAQRINAVSKGGIEHAGKNKAYKTPIEK